MRLKHSVSALALTVAAATATPVHAQTANVTAANVNVLNLLSPFLSLNDTSIGRQTLQDNLSQSIAINNAADLPRQQLAISDKNLLGSATNDLSSVGLGTYGAGSNLAGGLPAQAPINGITPQQRVGGLGAQLGAIYVEGAKTGLNGPLGKTIDLLARAYSFTGSDLGVAKNYFANGAATNPFVKPDGYVPTPAVAPEGYTLPTHNGLPNPTESVYDIAYGVTNTQPGQDVYGSSRPVQVRPDAFNAFDPTALTGLDTNPSFPSGHTTYAFTDSILLGMLVPQQYQSMVLRASEYGESRVVLGVHYPLDIIGSRALASYDLAQAFSNPLYAGNATTTGAAIDMPGLFNQAAPEIQSYLAAQCGAAVATCATSAANTADNPYVPSDANKALYRERMTMGLPTLSFEEAPREAAPQGGPDAAILLAPVYGGSTAAAKAIAPNGGIWGSLQTGTIDQIIENTENNAIAAFYGTALSYWTRIDLYSASGYLHDIDGTLRLDPRDVVTTDVTVADGGKLYANGSVNGAATVEKGGLLGGDGAVGSLAVQSGGAISPGEDSASKLTVTGATRFLAGSSYEVDVRGAQADKIEAGGAAILDGGKVVATVDSRIGQTYQILSAASVTGTFASVSAPSLIFADPKLSYGATSVSLSLERNDVAFESVGRTPNQRAVARALDGDGAGSEIASYVGGATSADSARASFDSLSGEGYASLKSTLFTQNALVADTLLSRLRQADSTGAASVGGPSTIAYNDPKAPYAPVAAGPVFATWAQGFGQWSKFDGRRGAAAVDSSLGGFLAGADVTTGVFTFGAAGGYISANSDIDARRSHLDADTAIIAAYAGAAIDAFRLRGGASYGWTDVDGKRTVSAPGGLVERPKSSYDGSTANVFAEAAYDIAFGAGATAGQFEPFAQIAWSWVDADSFNETNAPVTGLHVSAKSFDTVYTTLGGRVAATFQSGFGSVTPHALLAWRHAMDDVTPGFAASFRNGGGAFTAVGAPIGRDSLLVGAGLDVGLTANATIGVAYEGQFASDAHYNAVKGRLSIKF